MLDWTKIRSFNTSQNNAFEELVCQLARAEYPESFQKIGNPDGGVEGYCTLQNGKQYGWQAKYFSKMEDAQWNQITGSFHTALEKRPDLIKYYVCLPLDRADPKLPNKKYFMDKWNDKVAEWKEYAATKGRNIEFEYWGSSELIDRLSLEQHAGRRYFWFGENEFSSLWFDDLLKASIENLGERYTPELNFELEIAKNFDAIAINESYRSEVRKHFDKVLGKFNSENHTLQSLDFDGAALNNLKEQFFLFQNDLYKRVDLNAVGEICIQLGKGLEACEQLAAKKHTDDKEKSRTTLYHIHQLEGALYNFKEFINSQYVQLAHTPLLLLSGEMGSGKSHLLADVALNRSYNDRKSLLILGQHFTQDTPPWKQILENILQLNCSKEEFLGALSAKAEATGERFVIFVDAINEGRGKYFWPDHIAGFISDFHQYPWLALVLSIRTTYREELVPNSLMSEKKITEIHHTGFQNVEYEAIKKFFGYYGIDQPNTLILNPEFQNPLFLKLFCEGLKRSGMNTIPKGYDGITNIIKFYFSSINAVLAKPSKFDYSKSINLVEKAVLALNGRLLEKQQEYLEEEEAYAIVQEVVSPYVKNVGFLNSLISEGVLTKNSFFVGSGKWAEGIYLAYERFSDHFKAKFLFDKYVDKSKPKAAFTEGSYIHSNIFSNKAYWRNKGIIASLSIRLPEELGLELYEVLPTEIKHEPIIASAFVNSLLWRKPETITDKVLEYVNKAVLRYKHTKNEFFEAIISQAGNPQHYFNAKSLHANLMSKTLAARDADWTIYTTYKLEDESAIRRLIEWAWEGHHKDGVSPESLHLSGIALAWLLTSTNSKLRDSATKALISLFENKLEALIGLLREFEGVNDPYVYERLYAVAYGCTLRGGSHAELQKLAIYIYQTIFDVKKVYPHILLRDYARGVIEFALHLGIKLPINADKIRPPYKSDYPNYFPSNEEIDKFKFDYKSKDFKEHYWSQNTIIDSMITEYGRGTCMYGDFGRYTFQSALSDWDDLDPQPLSNLAVQHILENAYDVETHGKFDRQVESHSRESSKIERIGKKYQWIALHEILALVADKHKMRSPVWSEKERVYYQGPWEPSARDIDPSVIIKATNDSDDIEGSHWSSPPSYADWGDELKNWLTKETDLPDPKTLIEVFDTEGSKWLVMTTTPTWKEPLEIGAKDYGNPQKRLWYNIHSYLVKNEEVDSIIQYLTKQEYPRMVERPSDPERDLHTIFSREFYWSPAYQYYNIPYFYGEEWHEVLDKKNLLGRVLPTTERYLRERNEDYSMTDGLSFRRPHRFLYAGLEMRFSEKEGEFVSNTGQLICFDPCVNNMAATALLVKKDAMQNFLVANNLSIIWTVLGEKGNLGASFGNYARGIELAGIYSLVNGKIAGEIKTEIKK